VRHLSQDQRLDTCDFQSYRRRARHVLDLPQWYDRHGQAHDPPSDHGVMWHLSQDIRLDPGYLQPHWRRAWNVRNLPQWNDRHGQVDHAHSYDPVVW